MTGMFPNWLNLGEGALAIGDNRTIPTKYPFIAQSLRDLGYYTVAMGKWHLGASHEFEMPLQRGFDKFFGLLEGEMNYFTYEIGINCNHDNPVHPDKYPGVWGTNCFINNGYCLLEDNAMALDYQDGGVYFTELLAQKTVDVIHAADPEKPLFLYYTPTAPHSPLLVPEHYKDRCPGVETNNTDLLVPEGRMLICAMVAALDDAVFNITQALKDKGMWEDTLVVYYSDNGGVASLGSVNGQFRGQKGTFFEGGMRVPAFLSGPAMSKIKAAKKGGKGAADTFDGIIHVVDMYATIMDYAGGDFSDRQGQSYFAEDFHRKEMPLGAAGEVYGGSSCGMVFEQDGRYWKYTLVPDAVAAYVRYLPDYHNETFLFDLTNDPTESNNLMDMLAKRKLGGKEGGKAGKGGKGEKTEIEMIAAALQKGLELAAQTRDVMPSPFDKYGAYLLHTPTVTGCWIPEDTEHADDDCGLTPFRMSPIKVPTLIKKVHG